MTEKEIIRKEVERLRDGNCASPISVCDDILSFIDSMQEEPKFKSGDYIKPIDSCLGSPRIVKEVQDGWYNTDKGIIDFEFENNWTVANKTECPYNRTPEEKEEACKWCSAACNERKEQDSKLPKIWPRDTIEEYAYQCAYDLSNDWIRDNPEWEDVETACKLGAEWQKEKDKKWLSNNHKKIFTNGWSEGFEDGRNDMAEQMAGDSIEGMVHTYSNGELRISSKVLENNKYKLKFGDKVKLIVIKEDQQ